MNLGNDDRNWLDGKFSEVHSRITRSKEEQTAELHRVTDAQNGKIHELGEALAVHKAEPCADVQAHEAKLHGSNGQRKAAASSTGGLNAKIIGIIAALATAIAALAHLLARLVGGG